MNNGYITVVGSLNYDILFKQERLAQKGETYTADSVSFCGGGKGANQAVQCAKLGVKTYMVGKVGNDHFGEFLRDSLQTYGVDITHVGESTLNTGVAEVNVLADGSVFATISTGANFDIANEDIDALDDLICGSKVLILQMEIPVPVVEYLINKASAHGVYILLNAAPAKAIAEQALQLVDCLVVNETEASFYAQTPICDVASAREHYGKLLCKVKQTLIITLGKHGSLLCSAQGCTLFEADKTVKVIETTGAGDSYIGGFAYQKYLGNTDEEACRFASTVANVTVTKIGAQPAMPYLEEIV